MKFVSQKERCALADISTCRGRYLIKKVMIAGPIRQKPKEQEVGRPIAARFAKPLSTASQAKIPADGADPITWQSTFALCYYTASELHKEELCYWYSLRIAEVIRSKRMRCVGYPSSMREMWSVLKMLAFKSEGKRLLTKTSHQMEDNSIPHFTQMGCNFGAEWLRLCD